MKKQKRKLALALALMMLLVPALALAELGNGTINMGSENVTVKYGGYQVGDIEYVYTGTIVNISPSHFTDVTTGTIIINTDDGDVFVNITNV